MANTIQASNLVHLLMMSVPTMQKTEIYAWKGRGLSHVIQTFIFVPPLISSKPLMPNTSNLVHTLTTLCP